MSAGTATRPRPADPPLAPAEAPAAGVRGGGVRGGGVRGGGVRGGGVRDGGGGRHRAPPPAGRFNLALLWAGQFINTAGLMMLVPIMPFYLENMGLRDAQTVATWAGVGVAAPALALVVATPLWGRLGDRVGRKWMVARALLGLAAAMVVMASATTPIALVAGRLLQGLLGGVVEAAAGFASTTGAQGRRGATLGKSFSATAAGSLVGPLAGGTLIEAGGLSTLMLIVGGLAAALAVLTAIALEEPQRPLRDRTPRTRPSDPAAGRPRGWRGWRSPVPVPLAVAGAAAYLGVYGLIPIFPEYARTLVADPASAGVWVGVAQSLTWGATLVCSPLWGRRNDRTGRPVASFAAAALGCGLAIAAQGLPMGLALILVLRLVQGACFAALAQSLFFHASRLASERRAGTAVGSTNSFLLAGQSLGPLLIGPLTGALPLSVLIIGLGGSAVAAAALAWSMLSRESDAAQATGPTDTTVNDPGAGQGGGDPVAAARPGTPEGLGATATASTRPTPSPATTFPAPAAGPPAAPGPGEHTWPCHAGTATLPAPSYAGAGAGIPAAQGGHDHPRRGQPWDDRRPTTGRVIGLRPRATGAHGPAATETLPTPRLAPRR